MKPDKIKISVEFHINGSGLWLSAELPIAPEEDITTEFKRGKTILEDAYREIVNDYSGVSGHPMNGNQVSVIQSDKTPKDVAIDSQIEAISGCTSLKSLEIFKKLVDRENVPRLTEAYVKKLHSFED